MMNDEIFFIKNDPPPNHERFLIWYKNTWVGAKLKKRTKDEVYFDFGMSACPISEYKYWRKMPEAPNE